MSESATVAKGSALFRFGTLLAMLLVLAVSTELFVTYQGAADPRLLEVNLPWIDSFGVNFHLGVDGLNIYLLFLTALLFPVVLGCTWRTAPAQSNLFLGLMLFLEGGLIATFLAQNLMLFFIFWEAVLIPMFIMILVFGGTKSREAAFTFFLYTMAGSILLLAAVILLGFESLQQTGAWSFEFATLYGIHLGWGTQLFIFGAIVLACAVKCPLFPFHSWLPLAYCEAPTAGTALMAGAMSKMGAFALIKLALPLCPDAARLLAPYLLVLALVSIVYGAILALRQTDYKKLIAYSSLSHMGYIVLGIFTFHETALHGAMFQILSHGVAVAGLFLLLGLLEERLGDRWKSVTALSTVSPRLAVLLMLFVVTSVALPLTSGFTSEFMVLFGAFQQGLTAWRGGYGALLLTVAIISTSGMVLGAGYMLRFARSILFGKAGEGATVADLNLREAVAFVPLLLLIVWIGVWPSPFMAKTRDAITDIRTRIAGTTAVALATSAAVEKGGNHAR